MVLKIQVNAKNSSELFKSLESARAHLQGQLRSKEGENNRLTVEIKVCIVNYTLKILSVCLSTEFKDQLW